MTRRSPSPDALTAAVLRLADGDRSAFDVVYDGARPAVVRVCTRILGAGPDAEDASQDALVKVMARLGDYDPHRGPAMGWILTTAAWEARTHRRRRERRREGPLEGEGPQAEPTTDAEVAHELRTLAERLEPRDCEVVLAALGDQPRPQVPPATYRKRLQRALERLRALVAAPSEGRTP